MYHRVYHNVYHNVYHRVYHDLYHGLYHRVYHQVYHGGVSQCVSCVSSRVKNTAYCGSATSLYFSYPAPPHTRHFMLCQQIIGEDGSLLDSQEALQPVSLALALRIVLNQSMANIVLFVYSKMR